MLPVCQGDLQRLTASRCGGKALQRWLFRQNLRLDKAQVCRGTVGRLHLGKGLPQVP